MKKFFYKLFLWFKDRFSLLFSVVFRLHIGRDKDKKNQVECDEEHSESED